MDNIKKLGNGKVEIDGVIYVDEQNNKKPLNVGEVMTHISDLAKKYKKDDIGKSIKRNNHMNKLTGDEEINEDILDATVVDFINYIGSQNGMDYGMYTEDLLPKEVN